jgi:2-polyprenyl-6-methoxyphenol hydroxylase-like FAD-dependent oxidoreductase
LRIKDERGRILNEVDSYEVNERFGFTHNFAIHRADLHRVLLSLLKPDSLILGKTCIDFTQDEKGVTVLFQDKSTATGDCLVASDGIHSVIRKKLLPTVTPRYAGYTCWRAVIDNPPANFNVEESSETWGTSGRFGIVPLTENRIYWFACLNAKQNDPRTRSFKIADLLQSFEHFHFPIPEIIMRTQDQQLIWNDIIDLKPIKKFAFNKVVIMGDAAHATTPNMGQGACMAIEDAVVMTNSIHRASSVEEAFIDFEKKRIHRTTKIVQESWRLGKIAQLQNPLLVRLRNTAFKLTPPKALERQLEFLYNVSLY